MRPQDRYTYRDAGFNGLMLRTRKSNPQADGITNASRGSGKPMNFDLQQVAGSLGDNLPVGKVKIQGAIGRIAIENDQGTEAAWFGNLVK